MASRLEEILDYYNALNNTGWRTFRENTAAIKLFTNMAYITLHLKSSSPKYQLLNGIDVFLEDTEKVLDVLYSAMKSSFSDFIRSGRGKKISMSVQTGPFPSLFM